ncbi:MAG: GNAT family N-acetyltransferase [Eubacteriales bacterium]|nr:GNAT family N-acetyltransferase [Eubacteriales bacterium]
MICKERTLQLKDGTECVLRSPEPGDAALMLSYLADTAGETDFLTRCPEEVVMSREEEQDFLREVLYDPRRVMAAAFLEDTVLGCASVLPVGERQKLRHRGVFGIAIRKPWWQKGLGNLLTAECVRLARQMGYGQLELNVLAGNDRAIKLYERHSFAPWGRVKNGFKLKDGSYQDELIMGMIFGEAAP